MKRVRVSSSTARRPQKAKKPKGQSGARNPNWTKGVSGNPNGRPKGSKNKIPAIMKEMILGSLPLAAERYLKIANPTGEDFLAWCAYNHTDSYLRLLEKVLPFSLVGANGGPVQMEYKNVEEIRMRFKERGLPVPRMLAAPPKQMTDLPEVEVLPPLKAGQQ